MDSERNGRDQPQPGDERPCWLDVDLDAVSANVRAIRSILDPETRICAVVKADAYGLGAASVARAALAAGAERLAIARVEEGVRLRQADLRVPILLMAGFAPSEAAEIVRHDLTPTVVEVDDALALARAAARAGVALPVHLKVDTGLSRFGSAPSATLDLARLVQNLPSLRLEGLYTHFASADEPDLSSTRAQLDRLWTVYAAMAANGQTPPVLHAANSAATLAEPMARLDMVRLGITLSGHYPSPDVPRACGLRPAVSLRGRLQRTYPLAAGATVGYGRTYRADRPLRVGLVPLGYADGVPRTHSNGAEALIRGRRASLIGRVSMDQCVVDITDVPDARRGDVVSLFGADDGACVDLDEFASWSGTIAHEALCRIGSRVPRRYHQGGRSWWGPDDATWASPTRSDVQPVGRRGS
ncbi:MAG: alanine racemase [Chloroflexi bacterium]|nr:alanine racemase [Chloroflexota bacterium]